MRTRLQIDGFHIADCAALPRSSMQRSRRIRPCRVSNDEDAPLSVSKEAEKSDHQCGLVEAVRYARNDARLMAREFLKLDMRARQDVALLGLTVTRLDARARARAEKKVRRFGRLAKRMKEIAGIELRQAATDHWNDGALEADIRIGRLRARRRAIEDSFATFQAVKSIHNAVTAVLLMKANSQQEQGSLQSRQAMPMDQSSSIVDRISEFEKEYLSMASLLAEVNVLDHSDPDELEFIVATLLDLDEVQGASGASLVTQSASSPDSATRRALVDALADTPSLWALGNAGMSALQRLAKDENPEVAAAALKALDELKSQWEQIDRSMLSNNLDAADYLVDSEDPDED